MVLGEENLLVPVLNSIPKSISQVNVTMGLPLKFVPLASLFNLLFHIHRHNTAQYYHEDVVDLLSHPSIYRLFESNSGNGAKHIITSIQKYNFTYLNLDQLKSLVDDIHFNFLHELFESWTDNPKFALNQCLKLIKRIKTKLNQEKSNLELEYLFRFYKLFNQLTELSSKYKQQLKSIKILEGLFNELLTSETLDFQGEPLDGLQIMGMLESRVLDFETVIISSVNEGILPQVKLIIPLSLMTLSYKMDCQHIKKKTLSTPTIFFDSFSVLKIFIYFIIQKLMHLKEVKKVDLLHS